MEKIANITGVICISVFVMGLLYELGAFEKTSKAIKFVFAIYITATLFNSLGDMDINIQNTDFYNQQYQQDFNIAFQDELIRQTQEELECMIKKRLEEKNIAYNLVTVHILEQNGNLTADEIVIKCKNIYAEKAFECISDITDENTKIIIGE
ncbi:MAG: hypothetical protein E7483_00575 [Ruminococcaceae bacterium]|nr:hypothetical protein [Oscillospiraceae bacterium]